ncbi:MAG: hydroxyacid dehydrogenase [Anaerolineae bacterium]
MPDFNILITDGLDPQGLAVLHSAAKVDDRSGISADDLLKVIANYDALIVRGRTKVTAALLAAAPRLKVVGRAGVGVDNIDLEAAKTHGVTVVNAPTSTTIAVAELTFGLILALAREIPRADAAMKQGQWLKKELEGVELYGKTLGIIGVGRIGMEVAKRAAIFGMHVIAYDPLVPAEEIRQRGAEPVSLQELYAWADFISLHLPLTVQTRDMIATQAFAAMKDGVRIVCAARGGIIDEAALVTALNSGKVAGAALDVFASEPPGATALVTHPKVIATPHIGAQTVESQARAAEDIAHEVLAALRGEPLRWKVA